VFFPIWIPLILYPPFFADGKHALLSLSWIELSSIGWFGKFEIQGETTLRIYLGEEIGE
jgi:hypothetical protein